MWNVCFYESPSLIVEMSILIVTIITEVNKEKITVIVFICIEEIKIPHFTDEQEYFCNAKKEKSRRDE